MPVSAKASVLSARVVPTTGGETEWADMRAALDALDPATRERIADLAAYHRSPTHGAGRFESTLGYGMDEPLQLRPLVKVHPVTGRPSLFIGRHAHAIPGLREESDALLADLLERACQPPRVLEHHWQPGDLVVWDNRCVLHRAGEWDLAEEARDGAHPRRRRSSDRVGTQRPGVTCSARIPGSGRWPP